MKTMNGIYSLIKELSSSLSISGDKNIQLIGVSETLQHLIIQALVKLDSFPNNIAIVLPHQKDVFVWEESMYQLFNDTFEIHTLPYYIVWGPEKYVNHFQMRHEKLVCLHNLLKNKGRKKLILTTLPALSQLTIPAQDFLSAFLQIQTNTNIDLEDLAEKINALGYQPASRVEEKGSYSVRGGILDVFTIQLQNPVRIEFIGDKVNSIRTFSIETQRSLEELTSIPIVPAIELLSSSSKQEKAQALYNLLIEENVDSLEMKALMASFDNNERIPLLDALSFNLLERSEVVVDFLGEQTLTIFPNTIEKCFQSLAEFHEDIQKLYIKDKELNHATSSPQKVFLNVSEFENKFRKLPNIEFGNPLAKEQNQILLWKASSLETPKSALDKQGKEWETFFEKLLEEGDSLIVPCPSGEAIERARKYFERKFKEQTQLEQGALELLFKGNLKPKTIYLLNGHVPSTWKDGEFHICIIPFKDIFGGKASKQLAANRKLKNILSSFKELSVDDLVVHIDHGIGRYKGMVQLDLQEYKGDFLLIEYRNADKIYLPVDRLNLLQKYKKDEGGKVPPLDKLGSDAFVHRKAKALKSAENVAEELIKVHAERKILRGHSFSTPGDIYERFVEDFPYQETPDQLRCLEDLEGDFIGAHPMDRLVVGDVGFGKTEIAIRAALRAILEGFQVMFLVPTTVLCYQHFYNFTFRLEKHGVKLGQVHRLIKRPKQKESLEAFKTGKLDLLIGTHRILSQDVRPKNLGLLIVDEEQRFGVMQKEKLKKIKANVDILTLTATPIPRTLHMAILGLRDISLITTPPANRMPVKTMISPFEERLIKGAIEAEIMRGGQVFYLHNRIGNLAETANAISKLVPHAKVRTAHGQLHEEKLDAVIIDFIEQKFNVLVCTTIIESGVDMPNVNTLIVENAENFGLAQLHQLRGRVGRSSIQAYAYFLTKKPEFISDDSMKKLEYLFAHQELGSGFQLANYDLELRGAGSLIGKQQSGQIAGVGLELYVDMLEEKIKEFSSIKVDKKFDPEIKIKVTAIIPSFYIPEDKERLDIYKRLFSASAVEEIHEIYEAAADQYGSAPSEFKVLVKVALLRLKLRFLGADTLIELNKAHYDIRLHGPSKKRIEISLDDLQAWDVEEVRMDKLIAKLENLDLPVDMSGRKA